MVLFSGNLIEWEAVAQTLSADDRSPVQVAKTVADLLPLTEVEDCCGIVGARQEAPLIIAGLVAGTGAKRSSTACVAA